jgi:protein Tex
MSHTEIIAKELNIRKDQASATIELLDADNTMPFIARYRKEATGGLDEEQIRLLSEMLVRLRALDERRAAILSSIDEQGKLDPGLKQKLETADTITQLEDLYQPYRPKRRTRAGIAKEKGLQGLADLVVQQPVTKESLEAAATRFVNEQVLTVEDALAGARDIAAEMISDHTDIRSLVRQKALQWGLLRCEKIEGAPDERLVYQTYYEFALRVDRLRPHQVLAINRGEKEKVLRAHLDMAERDWLEIVRRYFKPNLRSPFCDQLQEATNDAAERLLLPAIERDVRRGLTEKAEEHAITVFATNLRALLSQPPLAEYTVIGVDPGFRTGCKIAVVDPTGKLLDTTTIYPHEPQKKLNESLDVLKKLIQKHHANLISIGNGTASRESEQMAAQLIHSEKDVRYVITNEAGASVYSASPLARAEFPQLDVTLRGAVSIARRVQDPLAELVKIDPKSIGVGLYQHDVDQARLAHALTAVVESVVNFVGVDVNTASPALLTNVSGIGPKLAEKIVSYRDEIGAFKNRKQLKEVSGLGAKAFEQSAGFLRIRGGENPLDASAIHPESYGSAQVILARAGTRMEAPIEDRRKSLDALKAKNPLRQVSAELGIGEMTLQDIFEQLVRPGRDPRADFPAPILRSDVLSMEDLTSGMVLKGTVRNVVDFGVFIDIGVKQDGMMHRSQMPQGSVLQVGDVIDVQILTIEKERGRIGLKWAG